MGFNPMMQFIHEEDVAEAIALSLELGSQGIYNVVGPGEVPLHTAIRETGGTAFPIPDFALRRLFDRLFRWGLQHYPPGVLDYLKYPVSLAGKRFVDETQFTCLFGLPEIFDSMRR
jgi:UDP-glucose 4-epimerase